jgi:hypothetical protein
LNKNLWDKVVDYLNAKMKYFVAIVVISLILSASAAPQRRQHRPRPHRPHYGGGGPQFGGGQQFGGSGNCFI